MYRGEIVALVDGRPSANKDEIGLLMATGGRAPAESLKSMSAETGVATDLPDKGETS
jgi:hypothetical protein